MREKNPPAQNPLMTAKAVLRSLGQLASQRREKNNAQRSRTLCERPDHQRADPHERQTRHDGIDAPHQSIRKEAESDSTDGGGEIEPC